MGRKIKSVVERELAEGEHSYSEVQKYGWTAERLTQIVKLYDEGQTFDEIAKLWNTSAEAVEFQWRQIKKRKPEERDHG